MLASSLPLSSSPRPLAAFDADGTMWETDACLEYFTYMIEKKLWVDKGDLLDKYEELLVTKGKEVAYGNTIRNSY